MNKKTSNKKNNNKNNSDKVLAGLVKKLNGLSMKKPAAINKKAKNGGTPRSMPAVHPVVHAFAHPHSAPLDQYIPSIPPLSTQKFACHQNFECICGTNGVGLLGVRPVFAKDRDSFVTTTAAFTGTTFADAFTNSSPTGVTGFAMASFPYTKVDMVSGNGGVANSDSAYRPRLVSMGISITYSGKATDRAGTINYLVASSGEDLSQTTLVKMIGNPQSVKASVNEMSEVYLNIHGTRREHYDLQYPESTGIACLPDPTNLPNLYYYDYTSTANLSAPPSIAVVYIKATASSSFNVDVVAHYEVGGEGPGCLLTPTFSDEQSLNVANNVSKISQQMAKANPHEDRKTIVSHALRSGLGYTGGLVRGYGEGLSKRGGAIGLAGQAISAGGSFMKSKRAVNGVSRLFKI